MILLEVVPHGERHKDLVARARVAVAAIRTTRHALAGPRRPVEAGRTTPTPGRGRDDARVSG